MYQLPGTRGAESTALASDFLRRPLGQTFSAIELGAIEPFFSNTDGRIFFLHSLPPNVGASLLARYSRMKNERGLRGVWVDDFVPYLLASRVKEVQESSKDESVRDPEGAYLKRHQVRSLDVFYSLSQETRDIYGEFVQGCAMDPEHISMLVESKRTRRMLSLFMDAYGHNSIARMASVWLCCEQISMLAAKSIEWTRPGTGYIELSGRFVDLGSADMYPIWDELALSGAEREPVFTFLKSLFARYEEMYGDGKGALPEFFRKTHGDRVPSEMTETDFERGVSGECFDVLSNLLPASTLTSVAIAAGGEALPTILKHLVLDGTAENFAIAAAIASESEKIGAHQFVRHWEPTEYERFAWERLSIRPFKGLSRVMMLGNRAEAETYLLRKFQLKDRYVGCSHLVAVAALLFTHGRSYHDKLPSEFEAAVATFKGCMTFRSWRDLQRMSLAAHNRTDLTPDLGFYQYPKPAPESLHELFRVVEREARSLYRNIEALGAPTSVLEYLLPLGFQIGYDFTANFREIEFCAWQRSKPDVNHEVRSHFVEFDEILSRELGWWHLFSRCAQYEKGREYLFARSEGVTKKGVLLERV